MRGPRFCGSGSLALACAYFAVTSVSAQSLVGVIQVPGEAADLHSGQGANQNRLGAFGSDLWYDRPNNQWYGLVDRGPGGGKLPYECRLQGFEIDVDAWTGDISNFRLKATQVLRAGKDSVLDGRTPAALGTGSRLLGLSFDPEGLAFGRDRDFFVSDEYGPSLYRFGEIVRSAQGKWGGKAALRRITRFEIPKNLVPVDRGGGINYVATTKDVQSLVTGRAPNRGFEGLAVSPDGRKLYAMLQSPLVEEGPSNDGDRGRIVRLVEFDTTTAKATRQIAYELEPIEQINLRITDEHAHFKKKKQGRATGISALLAIDDHRFLVLERDNRGIGIDNPKGDDDVLRHVGSKRIYEIDITAATDISETSLAGREALPAGVKPVAKKLFLDLQHHIEARGLPVPEKIEGMALGTRLEGGQHLLLLATDNDFSVTQIEGSTQYDVYSDGTRGPIDGDARGRKLLPTWIYAIKVTLP